MKMNKKSKIAAKDCVVIVWLTQSSSCSNGDNGGRRAEIAQLVMTVNEICPP